MNDENIYPLETEAGKKKRTRKLRLMYAFLNIIQRSTLLKIYSRKQTRQYIVTAKAESKTLIPRIPFIGGSTNYMSRFIELSALSIPLLKTLKNDGVSTRDTGHILLSATESAYNLMKKPFAKAVKRGIFSEKQRKMWKKVENYTRTSPYPFDYKPEFIEGDGQKFQYTIKYHACGAVKFFRDEGIEELAPYLCLTDYIDWDLADLKVSRTQTIANGGEFCDFKHIGFGSSGYRGWPPEEVPEWTNKFE